MQPPDNVSRRVHRVVGPRRRRDQIKFEPTRVSQARNGETTHLAHAHAVQPHGNPSKCFHRVYTPIRQRGQIKIAPTNVSQAPEDEGLTSDAIQLRSHTETIRNVPTGSIDPGLDADDSKSYLETLVKSARSGNAYQGLYKPILPLLLDPSDPMQSASIGGLLYGLQSLKNILQKVSRDDNKSITSSTHLSTNTSISARCDLPNRVTTPQSQNLRINKTQTLEQRTTHSIWNH